MNWFASGTISMIDFRSASRCFARLDQGYQIAVDLMWCHDASFSPCAAAPESVVGHLRSKREQQEKARGRPVTTRALLIGVRMCAAP
jgi:hypothetical protein